MATVGGRRLEAAEAEAEAGNGITKRSSDSRGSRTGSLQLRAAHLSLAPSVTNSKVNNNDC